MHAFIEGIKEFSIIYILKWYENVKMTNDSSGPFLHTQSYIYSTIKKLAT